MIGIIILLGVFTYINTTKNIDYQSNAISLTNEDIVNEKLYTQYPNEGDYIGKLNIPILNRILPIYEGTSDDILKQGVGHFIKSALPGENNNSVISGHRETTFKELNMLQIGDLLIIETIKGTFTYQVVETKIVDEDDLTVIVYTDSSVLTLTTCYPFSYFSKPDKRFIVIADLIENK